MKSVLAVFFEYPKKYSISNYPSENCEVNLDAFSNGDSYQAVKGEYADGGK